MTQPPLNRAPQNYRPRPHRLPAFIVLITVLVLAVWLAFGGYAQITKPNPRWGLSNGDTVEILAYRPQHEFSAPGRYGLFRVELVRFRSTLQDPTRDRQDIQAISDLVCPYAFRRGYSQMKIEAAPNVWTAVLRLSRAEWFRIDSTGRCQLENVH